MSGLDRALAFLAVAVLSVAVPNLHADILSATLNAGAGTDVLVGTTVGGVESFTYTNTDTVVEVPGIIPVVNSETTTFLATYADIAGVGVLNATGLCAEVTIVGSAVPCQALAFSLTDLTLGTATLVGALGTASVNLAGDVANINFAASLGGGTGIVDFTGPPPTSPVPEPGTLGLMATGLLGVGDIIRRDNVRYVSHI